MDELLSEDQEIETTEEEVKPKRTNAPNKGRFGATTFVNAIKARFQEEYPNSVPSDFAIDHTIKYLLAYIKKEIEEERKVTLKGFGHFELVKGIARTTGKSQYYPKFRFSPHFNSLLREKKGTATEAELVSLAKQREFMQNVWEKRFAYMQANRKTIPAKVIKMKEEFDKLRAIQAQHEYSEE